ncbi:hypothetical protein EV426DRAFT_374591 [Tirmania nivea]|nr:hypothetical protein EV426DRAFT_374591 [Tirmania nivea]
MKLSLEVALVAAASIIQIAAGVKCDSNCAACWKNGSPGVDIKFSCDGSHCGSACPEGYHGIHCAKSERCACVVGEDCPIFGPCWCSSHQVRGNSGDFFHVCDIFSPQPGWCTP